MGFYLVTINSCSNDSQIHYYGKVLTFVYTNIKVRENTIVTSISLATYWSRGST